jgi:hypothetical protein
MTTKTTDMNRRNFLRGTGVALGLPWLETFAVDDSNPNPAPKRFLSVYHPDGVGFPSGKIQLGRIGVGFPEVAKEISNSQKCSTFSSPCERRSRSTQDSPTRQREQFMVILMPTNI